MPVRILCDVVCERIPARDCANVCDLPGYFASAAILCLMVSRLRTWAASILFHPSPDDVL